MVIRKKGQIWIETVIYTLVGLALIGLVLAILTPKIKEFRDRTVIEETLSLLNVFDSKINEVLDAPGNKRRIEMTIDKGQFSIDPANDLLKFVLEEADIKYSEPGVSLEIGRVNVTTESIRENYKITLEVHYLHNITFEGSDSTVGEFTPVTIPYQMFVENRGLANGRYIIDLSEGN
ncbi:MAG: hypothetical protein ACP5NS_03185 [Candidatus Pacearchaeota archaeon]